MTRSSRFPSPVSNHGSESSSKLWVAEYVQYIYHWQPLSMGSRSPNPGIPSPQHPSNTVTGQQRTRTSGRLRKQAHQRVKKYLLVQLEWLWYRLSSYLTFCTLRLEGNPKLKASAASGSGLKKGNSSPSMGPTRCIIPGCSKKTAFANRDVMRRHIEKATEHKEMKNKQRKTYWGFIYRTYTRKTTVGAKKAKAEMEKYLVQWYLLSSYDLTFCILGPLMIFDSTSESVSESERWGSRGKVWWHRMKCELKMCFKSITTLVSKFRN